MWRNYFHMLKEVSRVKLLVESDKEYRSSYQGHQGFVKIFLAFLAFFFSPFYPKLLCSWCQKESSN